jgi:hypothetical protein
MAINVPEFKTVNYGNVLANVEGAKRMRLQNEVLGMQADEQRNVIANRDKARTIRAQVEGLPAQIEQLEAQGLNDEADQLRNSYITTRVNSLKMLSSMREAIDGRNYKRVRQDLIQSGAIDGSVMPTEYSDDWFRERLDKERSNLESLTRRWGEEGRVMAQDLVERDGSVIWEGKPYETTESVRARSGGADGKPWQMEAADTNAIRNAAAEVYGGFYDPLTGRYSGLNRQQQQQIASLVEEASRVYNESQGRVPHGKALADAARAQGINIEDLQQKGRGNPADPLNLLGGGGPPR